MTIHDDLGKMVRAGKFEPYIWYVRFPRFKNLVPATRIEFAHPVTALVGPNGVNKTSILRALYGVPEGKSTGTYWFSTATDAIPGDRATCIHGRKQNGEMVEVLKQRSATDKTSDYWEPSRPVKAYGMAEMPELKENTQPEKGRSKTRWDAIEKQVVYLEVSDRTSAFDRYFNYSGLSSEKNARKELIKRRAPHLQRAIEEGLKKLQFHTKERLIRNELLGSKEVAQISSILGRSYEEIRWVEHRFFQTAGVTVVLKSRDLLYTEAFAGSGEFAVCQIVREILAAKENSLILIDEPETALHPFAQSQLMNFLATQAKERLHQVIITTHAPAIIRDLPPSAIKVLTFEGGEVGLISQASDPAVAFFHIGEPLPEITTVYVEDKLSKFVVTRALGSDEATRQRFAVEPLPGGKSALWIFCAQFSTLGRTDLRVVFDGDAKPLGWPPKDATAISDDELEGYIFELVGKQTVTFHIDGGTDGGNAPQRRELQRRFITWVKKYVTFLPEKTPEEFILSSTGNVIPEGLDAKLHFVNLTKKQIDDPEVNAEAILTTQRLMLARIPVDNSELVDLKNFLVGVTVAE